MSRDLERQITELRPHDHLCLIYEDPAERTAVTIPFVRDGLSRGERCLYVVDPETIAEVREALVAAGVNVPSETQRGALALLTESETRLRLGWFDPAATVDFWRAAVEVAEADGFTGLRLAGDTTLALQEAAGADGLIELEEILQGAFLTLNITDLCMYERRRFGPSLIRDLLRTHRLVLIGGEICPNPYCEPPGLKPGPSSDEARVSWMIHEIRDLQRRGDDSRLLARASAALDASLDWDTTLASAAGQAVPALADWCLIDADGLHVDVRPFALAPKDPATERLAQALRAMPLAPGCPICDRIVRAARNAEPALIPDIEELQPTATTHDTEHLDLLRQHGTGSLIIVPLRARDRPLGVMLLGSTARNNAAWRYGPLDLGLANDLAQRTALAVDNARLYQQLAERERQLHDLVRRLLAAEEEERRRIAYDVHDGLAQVAAAASRHIQAFGELHRPRTPQARQLLARAQELAQQTVSEARRLVAGLRHPALDDFGLAAALRLEAEALGTDGWTVEYDEALGVERLPRTIETALFRVGQEALTNVRKHTLPGPVRLRLRRRDHVVRLEVRDWGRGFDASAQPRNGGTSGRVGLASMRERVAMLGGRLVVHSRPGEGTMIRATVPLSRTAAGEHGDRDRDGSATGGH